MNNKLLKVIKPFAMMDVNDEFELSADGAYVSSYADCFGETNVDNSVEASYESRFSISPSYAEQLIEAGYLAPVTPEKEHVNVFSEIERLAAEYNKELAELDKTVDMPACLRVEKETVLKNLVNVLNHLNSLKK